MSRTPRRIALTPIYNESSVILSVLERISPHVDHIILSEDCSTDNTVEILKEWVKDRPQDFLIAAKKNSGASGALKKGYLLITRLVELGLLEPDDLVVEIDSDGQHDPADIPRLFERWMELDEIDVVLARRDFSNYPLIKVIGNKGLTTIASLLGGHRYGDVESNYRVMPASLFRDLLEYFRGFRYSGAFEVGIILPRLGYRTDNRLPIRVPFYRSGSRVRDGFHVLFTGLLSWFSVVRRDPLDDQEEWLSRVREELVNDVEGL